jgi:hypothetical protein
LKSGRIPEMCWNAWHFRPRRFCGSPENKDFWEFRGVSRDIPVLHPFFFMA